MVPFYNFTFLFRFLMWRWANMSELWILTKTNLLTQFTLQSVQIPCLSASLQMTMANSSRWAMLLDWLSSNKTWSKVGLPNCKSTLEKSVAETRLSFPLRLVSLLLTCLDRIKSDQEAKDNSNSLLNSGSQPSKRLSEEKNTIFLWIHCELFHFRKLFMVIVISITQLPVMLSTRRWHTWRTARTGSTVCSMIGVVTDVIATGRIQLCK